MTVFQNKLSPDFSEGVDRKQLKHVRDRFLKINADRLDKTAQGLSARHQDILSVLPLLYQINHPLMPGFVSHDAPIGVSVYEPDKNTLRIAKSFSQTFKFKRDKRIKPRIHAIYMMGSTGTLAHSESSDVDLWLCFDQDISCEHKLLLSQKAEKIDRWANDLGLELHTFLMNAEEFRQGGISTQVDKESSGSAQHYLLLDEFYRTAILLAGRYPLWWLIPPAFEPDYLELSKKLLSQRFIKESEVLDFGSAASIPKNELMGAGLWQLYKGLDSPYKSVLKILLAEVYAQQLPKMETLSQTFKQAVYDNELEVETLDPYFLIYCRLEAYLIGRKEHKRLDLVRKSFYLKVAKKLSKRPSGRRASWQRKVLEKIVRPWGWHDDKFRYLDARSKWKLDQVVQERHAVVAELSYCYRFLSQYARENKLVSTITAEDLNLLGRKLYAIFQRKAGKVERVNPGIANSLWEENLAFHHSSSQPLQSDQHRWLLYRDLSAASDASFQPILKKTASFIEMLSWLYFNGILTSETRLSLVPGDSELSIHEIQNMVRTLEQKIAVPLAPVPQLKYQKPAYIKKLMLFINVGVDPMKLLSGRDMHRISDRTDSLDYGSERLNLVKTVDQIALNSWHEVMAQRFEMGETLMQNLQSYLQVCQSQLFGAECALSVNCFCPQRASAITERVESLFISAKKAFFRYSKTISSVRYIIEIEEKYHVLQFIDEQFRYFSYRKEADLYLSLTQRQRQYSSIVFDSYAQENEYLLKAVLPLDITDCVQVFYFLGIDAIYVVLLDEFGSLLRFVLPSMQEEEWLSSVNNCLARMLESRELSESIIGNTKEINVHFYKAIKQKNSHYKIKEVIEVPDIEMNEVHVFATSDGLDFQVDLSFLGKEFSHSEYGEQQYLALIHFARSQPDFNDRFPVKVTELLLIEGGAIINVLAGNRNQTIDSLRIYAQVEQGLAQAVQNPPIK